MLITNYYATGFVLQDVAKVDMQKVIKILFFCNIYCQQL